MTRRLRRIVVATAVAVVVVVCGQAAIASWQDTASASMPISSGSLAAATNLSATPACTLGLLPKVTLGWTATTTTSATGYRVFRKTGAGSYSQIATVSGASSTSYQDLEVTLVTTYTYYLQAYVGSWTADSETVTVTTLSLCI